MGGYVVIPLCRMCFLSNGNYRIVVLQSRRRISYHLTHNITVFVVWRLIFITDNWHGSNFLSVQKWFGQCRESNNSVLLFRARICIVKKIHPLKNTHLLFDMTAVIPANQKVCLNVYFSSEMSNIRGKCPPILMCTATLDVIISINYQQQVRINLVAWR